MPCVSKRGNLLQSDLKTGNRAPKSSKISNQPCAKTSHVLSLHFPKITTEELYREFFLTFQINKFKTHSIT